MPGRSRTPAAIESEAEIDKGEAFSAEASPTEDSAPRPTTEAEATWQPGRALDQQTFSYRLEDSQALRQK